jgi:bifunctional non-homologous end joining protein LigD
VRSHGLEGIIAKRTDSMYEPGRRTGLWVKHRTNLSHDFVIGGYVPGDLGVDSIVIGVYRGKDLHYAARVRAGFVPLTGARNSNGSNRWRQRNVHCESTGERSRPMGAGTYGRKMRECVW